MIIKYDKETHLLNKEVMKQTLEEGTVNLPPAVSVTIGYYQKGFYQEKLVGWELIPKTDLDWLQRLLGEIPPDADYGVLQTSSLRNAKVLEHLALVAERLEIKSLRVVFDRD